MKKIFLLSLLTLFLSGCATYRFHKGEPPDDLGFVASRDKRVIVEYTVGKESSLPDLVTAKERFKRRHSNVEYYYKKMGYIQCRFRQFFWEAPYTFASFITGIFRLPFIASSDYKYEHNPKYREKVDKLEEEKEAREAARIKGLKEKLSLYIEKDLAKEGELPEPLKLKKKAVEEKTGKEELKLSFRQEEQEITLKRTEEVQKAPSAGIVALITARPLKGLSPLKVRFSGESSRSPYGKITSYEWDFGDGDVSSRKNPVNTYFSASYGSRYFTVTLTVKDDKGNAASSSAEVEVITR